MVKREIRDIGALDAEIATVIAADPLLARKHTFSLLPLSVADARSERVLGLYRY